MPKRWRQRPPTRHPRRGCRVSHFAGGSLLALACLSATGAETGCEQVPESRRDQCRQVMRCMALDDDDARRACIDAAQRIAKQERPQTPQEPAQVPQQPSRPQKTEPSSRQASPPESQASPPESEREIAAPSTVASDQNQDQADPPRQPAPIVAQPAPPSLPDQFSGRVSRIYQSILDRQLIAVDASYLFESDRAAHARIEVGDRVDVEKISSRLRSGSRWRITGPTRTAIVAFRIRCERQDIRAADRRKCAQMLDR